MYQSNAQINEAFIAAVQSLEKLPTYWKLKELRSKNVLSGKIRIKTSNKCTCDDDYASISAFPYFFPLYPSEGQPYLGEYSVLPFFYLVATNTSRAFPIVELLEIPLLHKDLFLSHKQKEEIDSLLSGVGFSHIVSYIKVTNENLAQEITSIRKRVAKKIYDMTSESCVIFFSAFSQLPESLLLLDKTGYIEALSKDEENILWSKQSDKIIPIIYSNRIYKFKLKCWSFNRHEV